MGSIWQTTTPSGKARWCIAWTDETGRRRTKRVGQSRRQAEQVLRKIEIEVDDIRHGLLTASQRDRIEQARRPLAEHLDAYLADCEAAGQSVVHRATKRTQIEAVLGAAKASTIADVRPEAVRRYLDRLIADGKAARTRNSHLVNVQAFFNWCVRERRIVENPIDGRIRRLSERDENQRRKRRAFSDEELDRLIETARKQPQGGEARAAVYVTAANTGLRRGELGALTWGDVDLDEGVLTVRASIAKSKKAAHLPLHPDVIRELRNIRPTNARKGDRVFAAIPRDKTVRRDLERAEIPRFDEDGRQLDLHALRTTLGTRLARGNVPLSIARDFMRHASARVTERHYQKLELHDLRRGVDALGPERQPQVVVAAATGTDGGDAHVMRAMQRKLVQTPDRGKSGAPGRRAGNRAAAGDTSLQFKGLHKCAADSRQGPPESAQVLGARAIGAVG